MPGVEVGPQRGHRRVEHVGVRRDLLVGIAERSPSNLTTSAPALGELVASIGPGLRNCVEHLVNAGMPCSGRLG